MDAVDFIENDKIKLVEGRTIAKQIKHEVDRIYEVLERDLKIEYGILKGFGVETSPPGGQVFTTPTSQSFDFQAEVFKFDVVGFAKYIRTSLDKSDEVKTMIDLRESGSRVFIEISPVGSDTTRSVAEAGPSLETAISTAACSVVLSYLKDEVEYRGLSAEAFCVYIDAHRKLTDFIVSSANAVRAGHAFEPARVRVVAKPCEDNERKITKAPLIPLQPDSLYRMEQSLEAARTTLAAAPPV